MMTTPDRIYAKGRPHPNPAMEGHVIVFASVYQVAGTVEYVRATPELLALIEAGKNEPPGIGHEYEAWRTAVHLAARNFVRACARTQETNDAG